MGPYLILSTVDGRERRPPRVATGQQGVSTILCMRVEICTNMGLVPEMPDLERSRRNVIVFYYFIGLVFVVLLYTAVYNQLMLRVEGQGQSVFASLEFVVQTLTTTGYGQDSGVWSHHVTFLFVSLTQVTGIGIAFFTLRLIVIPLFNTAEIELDDRLTAKSDHVVICEYRRDSAVLLDELDELGIEYVLLSSDRESAVALADEGHAAIEGSPQDTAALERASIDSARAVITDAGSANVDTILTVRSLRQEVEIVALTDDSSQRDVLLQTGADSVLSPHEVLGHRLAEKAVSSVRSEMTDTVDIGADIEVTEVPIHQESYLAGTRIRNSEIREQTGANIIGAWIDGELQLPPDPDALIRPNTVLLVSGEHEALETLSAFTRPAHSLRGSGDETVVIAGLGEVGKAARSVVSEADIDTVTIDVAEHDGVDVVGDASDRETLVEAGIESADTVIVGLPDDSASLLTTVLARSLNPEMEILTRVSDADATRKARSAGADYVLSVPRVSARMVATELRGEAVLEPASQVRFIRVSAGPLAGSTLAASDIYDETGCRVIAVEDDDTVSTAVDPHREFTGDEHLTLVGSDEAVQQFLQEWPDDAT
jgi:voltage-gated potassium channel